MKYSEDYSIKAYIKRYFSDDLKYDDGQLVMSVDAVLPE
jgi:hypothetical protein